MDEERSANRRHVVVVAPGVEGRLDRLENQLGNEHQLKIRWKRAFAVSTTVALVGIALAVAAVSISSSSYAGISGEAVSFDDTLFAVTTGGVLVNAIPLSAQGASSGAAEEMGGLLAAGRTALGAANWTYLVTVAELSDGAVPVSSVYEAELFVNGTSQGSIFFQQAVNGAGVEALTLTWDIGADLPSGIGYTVRITAAA